jgi:large subunit ribosomal protein L7/L12
MAELDKIVDQLSKLTVVEATDLAKKLEKVWGVNVSSLPQVGGAPQVDSSSNKVQEKLEYDVFLDAVGDKRINVIKELKSIMGSGLKEAKDLAESAPVNIKSSTPKDEAEKIKDRLEAVGAKVTLK